MGVPDHTHNPSIWEVEVGLQVQGQFGLHDTTSEQTSKGVKWKCQSSLQPRNVIVVCLSVCAFVLPAPTS